MRANGMGIIEDEMAAKELIIDMTHKWGHQYPDADYGGMFYGWLINSDIELYNSRGNGSAMRVSSAGWHFDDLERLRNVARWISEATHNHPEGVKRAESAAVAIWMVRSGYSKEEIKEYIIKKFGYDLSRTCDEIRPVYTIMGSPVSRRFRKQSRHLWRERISRI